MIVGADEYVHKEVLAVTDSFRESTQSWREVPSMRIKRQKGPQVSHRIARRLRMRGEWPIW
ncbi:MAG: hypothetical protein ACNA7O_17720 [Rhodobacterales bacterium]